MKKDKMLHMNLQFFAEEGTDDSNDGNKDQGSTGKEDQNGDQSHAGNGETGEKTFTQAELSAVAATEKKQGKQSILNLFGVKSEKDAKEQAEAFKKWQDSQKDVEQKLKDSESNRAAAEAKALAAENKLTMMMAGVNKDSLEDVLAIASTRVTDDKDLSAVLEEMKKEPKYKGFFENDTDSSGSNGTGTSAGHNGTGRSDGKGENLGERLGKARQQTVKKSNFFTN